MQRSGEPSQDELQAGPDQSRRRPIISLCGGAVSSQDRVAGWAPSVLLEARWEWLFSLETPGALRLF